VHSFIRAIRGHPPAFPILRLKNQFFLFVSLFSSQPTESPGSHVQIDESWKSLLSEEFNKPYFNDIRSFLKQQKQQGKTIYPPGPLIFNAFAKTPVDKVRVVILGQDPYHNPGEATGLCFSVPKNVPIPASLRNIYKEIERDLGIPVPSHGDLTAWAEQGVFLLNAILTVERNHAGSHRNIGWQLFTDAVIRNISAYKENVIFLLWGNFAKQKKNLIDQIKHHVLEAVHPSPLAGNAFIGCSHFSRTNELLIKDGNEPINWSLS
jgi:uracil-DNA glycosylase